MTIDPQEDVGRSPTGPGSRPSDRAADGVSPLRASIPIAELARHAYRTIDAFGWSIQWARNKPVPDDAWPIDIIRRQIEAALQQAAQIARDRMAICLSGADHYAEIYPNDHYWSSSERCAAWEARHIAELIESYAQGIVSRRQPIETRSGSTPQGQEPDLTEGKDAPR